MNTKKIFTTAFLVILAFLICATILITYFIDPYELFNSSTIPIERKPFAQVQIRTHKIFQLHKIKPKTIILGTSRAAVGFNPENPLFDKRPVYNLGIDGANIYEISKYFNAALKLGTVKEVYLLLDFMSFNANLKNKPDFNESLLTASKHSMYFNKNSFLSLFSYDSLKDSFNTIIGQYDPNLPTLNANGQTLENALYHYMKASIGRLNTSINSEKTYRNYVYLDYSFNYSDNKQTFDYLLEIIHQCHQNNISLHLIIGPIHARHQALIYDLGLWEHFTAWKKIIFTLNQNAAQKNQHNSYDLWDFSSLSPINQESMIESNLDAPHFYWESTHFHQSLGNLILQIIKGDSIAQSQKDFGTLLTQSNLELLLATNTNQIQNYSAIKSLCT